MNNWALFPATPDDATAAGGAPNGDAAAVGAGLVPKGDAAVEGGEALPKGEAVVEGAEPKGDGAGGAVDPNGVVEVADPKGEELATLEVAAVDVNGDLETSPPNVDDVDDPGKGDADAKPVEGAGAGPGAAVFGLDWLSSGLGTLYFAASFLNISSSLPYNSRSVKLC